MAAFAEVLGHELVRSSGETLATSEALKDVQLVAVLFSASWCKPCRHFSPTLKRWATSLNSGGRQRVAVVLISSDRDVVNFREYVGNTPSDLAVPFQSDAAEKLTNSWGIAEVPTLVLLDRSGKVLTQKGKELVDADPSGHGFPYPGGVIPPKPAPAAAAGGAGGSAQPAQAAHPGLLKLFDGAGALTDRNGRSTPLGEALGGKGVVGVYFSAHWCPPCRQFTPQLAQWYKATKARIAASGGALPELELVFASSDQGEAQFRGYLDEMPWKALPFGSPAISALGAKYAVRGIPTLVFVRADGTTLTKDGRSLLASQPSGYPWS